MTNIKEHFDPDKPLSERNSPFRFNLETGELKKKRKMRYKNGIDKKTNVRCIIRQGNK